MSAEMDLGTFKADSIVRLTWGGKTYEGRVIRFTEKFPMFKDGMMRGVQIECSDRTRIWFYENEIDSFEVVTV